MTRARPPPPTGNFPDSVESRQAKLLEELHHDLWDISKSLTPMSPEDTLEAWTKTVDILEALCPLTDVLGLEPLLPALTDATDRADEEAERARDRAERPEGVQVSESEDRRLKALLDRSDALANARVAVEDWSANPQVIAPTREVLTQMSEEAHEAFLRYRREVGLPE
jgi:hypothetical protein